MVKETVNMDAALALKYQELQKIFSEMDSAIIAMSGGVDSVLLAKTAHEVLGDRSLAVTGDSASIPRRELEAAAELARRIGIRHLVIATREIEDERYAANPVDRCYFCKNVLFGQLDYLAEELDYQWVCYGENVDDQGDHRPGARAAKEHFARAPLKEAGLTKPEIRTLAKYAGLPVWDKPAAACLASRFPYGTRITPEKLAQVEKAENALWELGFRQYRVRYHDEIARIEVAREEMQGLLDQADQIIDRIRKAGFKYVAMDLAGYRRGSLNQGIIPLASLEFPAKGD